MDQKPSIKFVLKTLLRLYLTTKEYIKWGFIRLLGGIGSGSLGVLSAYLSGRMVGVALSRDTNVLIQYAAITIGALIARSIISYINVFANQKYSIYSGKKLRILAMEKINSLPIAYYENKHTGDSISKLVNDIEILQNFYGNSVAGIWSYVPTSVILSAAVLIGVNLKLTLICGITIPIFMYLINKISVPISKTSKNRQEGVAEFNSYLRDFVEGVHIYKSFNMHKSHSKKFEEACSKVAKDSFEIAKRRSYTISLSILGMIMPQIIAIGTGSIFVATGQINIEQLFVFTNVLWPFLGSFRQITQGWTDMIEQAGRADHLFKLYDTGSERQTGKNYSNNKVNNIIEFKDVGFSYNEKHVILKNINFNIRKGEKTALVGSSGSGKTTIHKLICGFYNTYAGDIYILDKKLKDWNLEDLRKNIAAVNQEIYLFNNSIKENIQYGKPDATDEEIVEAAKQAYAHDFITSFEKGYDTEIGERGLRLSGGQRQRIAIARAILKDAPIILLDEPTSALDTKSEYYVQMALEKLEEGKTVFIIAHRLSTIENADKIIVLDDGVVCEEGLHSQLIQLGNKYTSLYKRQVAQTGGIAQ